MQICCYHPSQDTSLKPPRIIMVLNSFNLKNYFRKQYARHHLFYYLRWDLLCNLLQQGFGDRWCSILHQICIYFLVSLYSVPLYNYPSPCKHSQPKIRAESSDWVNQEKRIIHLWATSAMTWQYQAPWVRPSNKYLLYYDWWRFYPHSSFFTKKSSFS